MPADIPLTTYIGSTGATTGTFTINPSATGPYIIGGGGGTGIGIGIGPTYTINPNDTIHWNTTTTIVDPFQRQLDELKTFMNEIKAERELRKKYPALDHAYEQYEVLLEMCKSKEADDAAGENSKNP